MLKYVLLVLISTVSWFFLASYLLICIAPHFHVTLHTANRWTIFWPVWWQNHQHMEWHINTILWIAGSGSLILIGVTVAALLSLMIKQERQPNLYGTSRFADTDAERSAGGIMTEKR